MTRPYFYIIEHISTNKKYAGSRWAKNCSPEEFMKPGGYTTSSNKINDIIKREGLSSFNIVSLIEMNDPYEYETIFLVTNDCSNSDEWFNSHNNSRPPPFGSEQFKTIMKQKYGVTHNTSIVEVKAKMIASLLQTYKENPEMLKNRAKKIAEARKKNGTTGIGISRTYTNNGLTGKWKRSENYNKQISNRQKEQSLFSVNNPMNDPEKRLLVSLSKIGRKKYYNPVIDKEIVVFPGNQPEGFIMGGRKKYNDNKDNKNNFI